MAGGSFDEPVVCISWPGGEFGAMGMESAVKLGFKKDLEAETDPEKRKALDDMLLEGMYIQGKAVNAAASTVFDAVIDPADSRRVILRALLP